MASSAPGLAPDPFARPSLRLASELRAAQSADEAATAITDESLPCFKALLRHFVADAENVETCKILLEGRDAREVKTRITTGVQRALAELCNQFILVAMQKRRASGSDLPYVGPLPSPAAESGPWVSVFAILAIASVGSWVIFASGIGLVPKAVLGGSLVVISLTVIVKVFRKNAKQVTGTR